MSVIKHVLSVIVVNLTVLLEIRREDSLFNLISNNISKYKKYKISDTQPYNQRPEC